MAPIDAAAAVDVPVADVRAPDEPGSSDSAAPDGASAERASDAAADRAPDAAVVLPERRPLWARAWSKSHYDSALAVASGADESIASGGFAEGELPIRLGAEAQGGGIFVHVHRPRRSDERLRFGRGQGGAARALGFDASNNLYVAGTLRGTVDFGPGPLTAIGTADIFLTKLDLDNKPLWSARFGGTGADEAFALAVVPASGEVILAGSFEGSVVFGSTTLTSAGSRDVFVVRLAADGTPVWARRFGGPQPDEARGVTVDGAGSIVVAGSFSGTADLGAGSVASAGSSDGFVVKLAAAGATTWARNLGGPGLDAANGVTADMQGNIAVAGAFMETMDLGTGPLASAGGRDLFVSRLSPTGATLWSKRGGGLQDDVALGIAGNAAGAVHVTGAFQGRADLGGSPLQSIDGALDAFVASYAADGSHTWSKAFGGTGVDSGNAIALHRSLPAIAGLFADYVPNPITFGAPSFAHNESDAFLAIHDGIGRLNWVSMFTSLLGEHQGHTVAPHPDGSVAVLGTFDFGVVLPGAASALTGIHAALLDIAGDGTPRAARVLGEQRRAYAEAMAHDSAGNLFIAGNFRGTLELGGMSITGVSESDMFVAKLAAGRAVWLRRIVGSKLEHARELAIDREGNVYVTGGISGTIELDSSPASTHGGVEAYVLKLSPAGAPLWFKRFTSSEGSEGVSLGLFADSSLVLAATLKGRVDVGGTILTGPSRAEGFLVKYSAAGAQQWVRKLGDPLAPYPYQLVVDARDEIAIVGTFAQEWKFGDRTWRTNDGGDAFVAKLSAAGAPLWSKTFTGSGTDFATGVATTPEGTLVVTGGFRGTMDLGTAKLETTGGLDVFLLELRDPWRGRCWGARRTGRGSWWPGGGDRSDRRWKIARPARRHRLRPSLARTCCACPRFQFPAKSWTSGTCR